MADRKILNLEVNAGLCNRLRALIAGICWAEKLDRKLIVFWPSFKPECAAAFYQLFAPDSVPEWVAIVNNYLEKPETCLQAPDARRIFSTREKDQVIDIKSHGNFWDGDRDIYLYHLRRLRPSREVQDLLDKWERNELNSTDIAVHIRMTDNEKAIRLSPFQLFVGKIHELGTSKVAVFSDEPRAVQALQEMFGGRIVSFETVRKRNTLEGMIEAAAVFFALARKRQIFGSANSSFSEIAREYGGVELVLLRQD